MAKASTWAHALARIEGDDGHDDQPGYALLPPRAGVADVLRLS